MKMNDLVCCFRKNDLREKEDWFRWIWEWSLCFF